MARALLVVAVLLAVPPAAVADQRFAAPGAGATGCTGNDPCDIATAISGATAGDEVILASGDYNAPNPLVSTVGIAVHGIEGQPRPRILGALSGNFDKIVLDVSGPGASVRHLEVRQDTAPANVVALSIEGTADRVVAVSGAVTGAGCVVLGASVLTNSLCLATGANTSRGVYSYEPTGAPAANTSIIRNVTAISTASDGRGIAFVAGSNADDDVNATVTNTIAHGDNGAVQNVGIEANAPSLGSATVNVDHSHYYFRSQPDQPNGMVVSGQGNLVLQAMTFADGYHLPAGSPVIDAGIDPQPNHVLSLDLDGDQRPLGAHIDMGADEFVPPAPPPDGSGGPGGPGGSGGPADPGGGGPGGGVVGADTRAPSFVGGITFGARRFAAAARGGSVAQVAQRRRRPPVGTTVTFRLDEAATVAFGVERRARGRRSGRRCVKPTRANRRARRCARWVRQRGTFTVDAAAGATTFRFTGRLGGRRLRPGRLRLAAVARDAAGNTSAPRRAAFRIVRRRAR